MLKRRLLPYLPPRIQAAVAALPEGVDETATELRLRADAPASVTSLGKNRCFDEHGRLCGIEKALRCSEKELSDCIALLTQHSLYSFGESMKHAYVPFGEGCRAGIGGEAIVKDGVVLGFRRVLSINLRVSRFVRDCGYKAALQIAKHGGALIYSPPACGKTTLLRSIALLLADGSVGRPCRVAVADERGELYVPELRAGLVDVISGVEKGRATELLCRSMAPQYIICDELGANDEEPCLQALNTGVATVASVHAGTREGLLRRPFVKRLLDSNAFPLLIRLSPDYSYETEEYP